MMFNVNFNNISVILVEETGIPRENHRPVASHQVINCTQLSIILTFFLPRIPFDEPGYYTQETRKVVVHSIITSY